MTELEGYRVAFLNRRVFGGKSGVFKQMHEREMGFFKGGRRLRGEAAKMHYGVRRVERVQRF